jgi:D-aminopeptidase
MQTHPVRAAVARPAVVGPGAMGSAAAGSALVGSAAPGPTVPGRNAVRAADVAPAMPGPAAVGPAMVGSAVADHCAAGSTVVGAVVGGSSMLGPALCAALLLLLCSRVAAPRAKPRARDLGVPFEGSPGPLNAITDVAGVEVGYTTLISGSGELKVGVGPVRTGVTAILPRGKSNNDPVFAGWFSQNGDGEMTGTAWVEESGFLDSPVMITNTHSVGVVRDAVIAWQAKTGLKPPTNTYGEVFFSLPVVAETFDGRLNDVNGFHVKPEHVFQAIESAAPGRPSEGNVGGGTGMICYGFKGGTGTSSRKVQIETGSYTVGALVQCNCGGRSQLRIAGVPVGAEIPDASLRASAQGRLLEDVGSIIIVVATDAPLLPQQLKRLARRATMGLARTGSTSGNSSGDLFLAFSTANSGATRPSGVADLKMLSNNQMNGLFSATVDATEEAIVNALVGAETMTGVNNHTVVALPHDRLREVLQKYNRLVENPSR